MSRGLFYGGVYNGQFKKVANKICNLKESDSIIKLILNTDYEGFVIWFWQGIFHLSVKLADY